MAKGLIKHSIVISKSFWGSKFFGLCRLCGLGLLIIWANSAAMASQNPLSVVASIKPIHSLVSAVMGDIGTPQLLLKTPSSAHHFTLKPSQARSLQAADIVFWVGPTMEQPLTKALATLAPHAQTTPLIDASGLVLFEFNNPLPAHKKSPTMTNIMIVTNMPNIPTTVTKMIMRAMELIRISGLIRKMLS